MKQTVLRCFAVFMIYAGLIVSLQKIAFAIHSSEVKRPTAWLRCKLALGTSAAYSGISEVPIQRFRQHSAQIPDPVRDSDAFLDLFKEFLDEGSKRLDLRLEAMGYDAKRELLQQASIDISKKRPDTTSKPAIWPMKFLYPKELKALEELSLLWLEAELQYSFFPLYSQLKSLTLYSESFRDHVYRKLGLKSGTHKVDKIFQYLDQVVYTASSLVMAELEWFQTSRQIGYRGDRILSGEVHRAYQFLHDKNAVNPIQLALSDVYEQHLRDQKQDFKSASDLLKLTEVFARRVFDPILALQNEAGTSRSSMDQLLKEIDRAALISEQLLQSQRGLANYTVSVHKSGSMDLKTLATLRSSSSDDLRYNLRNFALDFKEVRK